MGWGFIINFRLLALAILLLPALLSQAEASVCQPFRVHRRAPLPSPPGIEVPRPLPVGWEDQIVDKIARTKSGSTFREVYGKWRLTSFQMTDEMRYEWLHCIHHYVRRDTDKDGSADWTAIVDQKPSRVLYPHDPDIDGDGIENVVDRNPMRWNAAAPTSSRDVPPHLLLSESSARLWQKKLRREYGLLTIDHTARHSAQILKEFYFLLKKGFSPSYVRSLKNLKYIYAFYRHDGLNDLAAYHLPMQAISVGGVDAYPQTLGPLQVTRLQSVLAHELGHAVLLEKIPPHALREICEKHGWKDVFSTDPTDTFYADAFFRRHPGWGSTDEARQHNFFSNYSYSNAHEWFADAFAEMVTAPLAGQPFGGSPAFSEWVRAYMK